MRLKPHNWTIFQRLHELWTGHVPLARAFWTYTVIYGLILNLVCSAGSLVAYLTLDSMVLALFLHVLPLPYLAFATVGVWRSAARDPASQLAGLIAKAGSLIMIGASVVI